MLRGITAHMLLTRVHPVGKGTTMLVHAAAGGLGLILTQWAKSLGATVIGTVGSPAKAELARAAGLDHAILYRDADFAAETRRLTGGRGVDVAYDGIGGDTLLRTLDVVSLFGTVVSVGQAAGTLPQIPLTELGPRRSIALARPSVFAYANDAAAYAAATDALFGQLAAGLKVSIGMELDLAQAAEAHMRLERGETKARSCCGRELWLALAQVKPFGPGCAASVMRAGSTWPRPRMWKGTRGDFAARAGYAQRGTGGRHGTDPEPPGPPEGAAERHPPSRAFRNRHHGGAFPRRAPVPGAQ
jgi:hypothetical protein